MAGITYTAGIRPYDVAVETPLPTGDVPRVGDTVTIDSYLGATNNPTQITYTFADGTQTRTVLTYDGSNRLLTATTTKI